MSSSTTVLVRGRRGFVAFADSPLAAAQARKSAAAAAADATRAEDARDIVESARPHYATRAAGAAALATGSIFVSDEEGAMAWYRRTGTTPNYVRIDYAATKALVDAETAARIAAGGAINAEMIRLMELEYQNAAQQAFNFQPASLVVVNTYGGFWTPDDPNMLFQDVAMTTPADVGDPCRVVLSKAKGRPALVAPSDAARPVVAVDSNGFRHLLFDGVDDQLKAAFPMTLVFDRISCVKILAWQAGDYIFSGHASYGGSLYMSPSSPTVTMFEGSDGPSAAISLTDPDVVTEMYYAGGSRLQINNGLPILGAAGVTASDGLTVGASPAGAGFTNMRWYGTLMIDRELVGRPGRERGYTRHHLAARVLGLNVCVLGDSTVAANGAGQPAIASFFPEFTGSFLAQPGETIAQQRTRFDALTSGQQLALEAVIVQVGLNDLVIVGTDPDPVSTIAAAMQSLIDDIRAKVDPECKIYIATMTPTNGRTLYLGGSADLQLAVYNAWKGVNEAFAGVGPNPVTGVDGRITQHTKDMAETVDGLPDSLSPKYDVGDKIHPIDYGRRVNAAAWRRVLTADGLLRVA